MARMRPVVSLAKNLPLLSQQFTKRRGLVWLAMSLGLHGFVRRARGPRIPEMPLEARALERGIDFSSVDTAQFEGGAA